jgi:hypothetical protein
VQAYDFTGSAVSPLAFSFVSRSLATGDTLAYYADNGTGQYERGLGTWNATAFTLTRTTIRESSAVGNAAIAWNSYPTVWSDGRQEEDLTFDPSGTASGAISTHVAAADPHPNYALESALGNAASKNVGTTSGTVAAGDAVPSLPLSQVNGGWGEDATTNWDGTTQTLTAAILQSPVDSYLEIKGQDSATTIGQSLFMFGGSSTVTYGGEFQQFGGSGRLIGGQVAISGGMAEDGYGGDGGDLQIFSGMGDQSTPGALGGRLTLGNGLYGGTMVITSYDDGTDSYLAFFGAGGYKQPTITGSRGGNAALANLLTALENLGLIVDSTT